MQPYNDDESIHVLDLSNCPTPAVETKRKSSKNSLGIKVDGDS
jgi:hypothetical protein